MASQGAEVQPTVRRDTLLRLQAAAQAKWGAARVFEVDAPEPGAAPPAGKFFGTFPYPYMNGLLHLGHAFSLSKLEFASAYHRLCGRAVLFPQGFHCTGMPIKACADKLARELATYGNPPQFPSEDDAAAAEAAPAATDDDAKFVAKKSKAAAKKGTGSTQFAAPSHWLRYFPPLAMRDIKAMGCGVDWRRSFVTTDLNPYYDSFVRWHMDTLHAQARRRWGVRACMRVCGGGKIVKDKRYAVYSPLDGQPCADHDRATGEGEYVLIKMRVLELPGRLAALQVGQGDVPETMYGQTNCWALPDGDYGAFRGLGGEVYVMTDRAALNLSYQDRMPVTGQPAKLLSLKGTDLLGLPLKSPRAPYEVVRVLPLLTILTSKGTGIVTSVPSDAPDDYAALMDLGEARFLRCIALVSARAFVRALWVNKPKLREKFGIADEWVLPYEVVPIIDIPGFGDRAAEKVCTEMKIQSQNDTKKLAEAKQLVYLKGFTDGVLLVGPHAGKKVSEVKALIKGEMVDAGEALLYRLPWDPVYLVESLSDSTIYMAYYAVAHVLQGGDMYGEAPAPAVRPEQLTHEMRREFEFWYPMDVRVSGKDLIQNHLTFCLYNHTAIWAGQPDKWPLAVRTNGHLLLNAEKMSKSTGNFKTLAQAIAEYSADAMRVALADAGDAMDDANFEHTTANGAVLRVTRELAWIEESLAAAAAGGARDEAPASFLDRVFENEIDIAVHRARAAYDRMLFREALKVAMYDLQNARDVYRFACGPEGPNARLLRRYIEVSTLLMAPITPHTSEHVWGDLLKREGLVVNAGWPAAAEPDFVLQQAAACLEDAIASFRKSITKAEAPPRAKKGEKPTPPAKVARGDVYVVLGLLARLFDDAARAFPADALPQVLAAISADPDLAAGANAKALKQARGGETPRARAPCFESILSVLLSLSSRAFFPPPLQMVMPFAKYKCEQAVSGGKQVLDVKLPFDEAALLEENSAYLLRPSHRQRRPRRTRCHLQRDGEDLLMHDRVFFCRGGGFFLELGALDGRLSSNTLWYEQALGWRGLLVEATPVRYQELVLNRPDAIAVQAAVCSSFGTVHYAQVGGADGGIHNHTMNGIYEWLPPWFKEVLLAGVDPATLPTVPCVPLGYILDRFGITEIDLFILDVEGAELEDQAVHELLVAAGMVLIHKTPKRNGFYVHSAFQPRISARPSA
eukprot:scaffold11.g4074.t1